MGRASASERLPEVAGEDAELFAVFGHRASGDRQALFFQEPDHAVQARQREKRRQRVRSALLRVRDVERRDKAEKAPDEPSGRAKQLRAPEVDQGDGEGPAQSRYEPEGPGMRAEEPENEVQQVEEERGVMEMGRQGGLYPRNRQ